MAKKNIYAFGGGTAQGEGGWKDLLGGKGAGLAEMSRLGIPVPPGFTLSTEVCTYFHSCTGTYPPGLTAEIDFHLERLAELSGLRFGDPERPLLLSVRSGAARSMPGMMDTLLNLGLNREILAVQVERGGDPRFFWDAYRRLLTLYGDVVLGVGRAGFEDILTRAREAEGAATDAELSAAALERVASEDEAFLAGRGQPFPSDPRAQLWGAIGAVLGSWNNPRAREYRRIHGIAGTAGTAVNVQAMVFGNRGPGCATGVAFTRNPATGEPGLYGEYLINAQGEDVVAGIRTPQPIRGNGGSGAMADLYPEAFRELVHHGETLERHFRDMQDLEFTLENGRLFLLQTRTGKRTGPAAVRIAADLVEEGVIAPEEALQRVEPQHLEQMLAPDFEPEERRRAVAAGRLLARGLPAGPGAASGRIALSAEAAARMAATGPVLLVRAETSADDIVGMYAAAGILTSRGGMTSHAAVVARGFGKPCIVGAGALSVDEEAGEVRVGERVLHEGDSLSIDGSTGEVIAGLLGTHASPVLRSLLNGAGPGSPDSPNASNAPDAPVMPGVAAFRKIVSWADGRRRLAVRANADTPHDARVARALGAQGIGLCRTEHMFFAADRLPWVQRMVLADSREERAAALARLLPMQQQDFEGIFAAMSGLPVTVRLLDPPLHEFLPHDEAAVQDLAQAMEIPAEKVKARMAELAEANPMLGHRGCRLGLSHPEIYDMQVEALARAACRRRRAGDDVRPEIMVPLVGTEEEMIRLRAAVAAVLERVRIEEREELPVSIGTMIEVPRAALVAGSIARHADFFSFGTNDLTQMTFGYSRDDVGHFLPGYLETGILPCDPFAHIDEEGTGQLVRMAALAGRKTRPGLHLGICGEHGGDPASIAFFERAGLDYVSCSPYRVPIARLAAAQALDRVSDSTV